jgi:ATP phosphoribosyltransferase regulatory subunit
VTLRIPSGTRDVLPEEMGELRRIERALLDTFLEAGYGEISTPAVEYEETLKLADLGLRPSYRVVGEHGEMLALRADMTVPIARVVATRYPVAEPPLRFCYAAHAYRAVRPHRGQMREFLQSGIELIGAPGPEGTAEALHVLCRALEATGLRDFSIGLGDAALYPRLLDAYGVPAPARGGLLHELGTRDLVAIDRRVAELGLPPEAAAALAAVPRRRGAPADILAGAEAPLDAALEDLRAVVALLAPDIAARVIIDLGRFPRLGYYTGAMFEVYDPQVGEPLGGGGRYDDLLGRFGRPLPAVGFALGVDRLHAALAGEERGETRT